MVRSIFFLGVMGLFFASLPASSNYKLDSYGLGSGGSAGSSSTNYKVEGITGETSGTTASSSTYSSQSGYQPTQQANEPGAPTFVNSSNWYDKLHLTIDTGSNPSDTKFAIAISSDGFATTKYVKSDDTVGTSLSLTDYQDYATWGGSSGFNVIGLTANTTYTVKVKAMQGNFTETGYGPTASAATVNPSLTFDIDISATDSETNPPYNLDIGSLLTDTVVTAPQKIWLDFETNGDSGGHLYISANGAGLTSSRVSYTITSSSANLSSASQGFGAEQSTATQSSGGPLTIQSPYDGTGNNVGITNTAIRPLYATTAPIVAGRASFLLKARSTITTPSSNDYTDLITILAAANY